MPQCELTETCIFFNGLMADMPAMTVMYKDRYCRGDFMQCARYRVRAVLGKDGVPEDLYPNDRERAEDLLDEG